MSTKAQQEETKPLNPPQRLLVIVGIVVSILLTVFLALTQHVVQPLLALIGIGLGFTLFHARFGFTSAFRRLASVGNGQSLRAHMLMLAVACLLFAPILAVGTTFLEQTRTDTFPL